MPGKTSPSTGLYRSNHRFSLPSKGIRATPVVLFSGRGYVLKAVNRFMKVVDQLVSPVIGTPSLWLAGRRLSGTNPPGRHRRRGGNWHLRNWTQNWIENNKLLKGDIFDLLNFSNWKNSTRLKGWYHQLANFRYQDKIRWKKFYKISPHLCQICLSQAVFI